MPFFIFCAHERKRPQTTTKKWTHACDLCDDLFLHTRNEHARTKHAEEEDKEEDEDKEEETTTTTASERSLLFTSFCCHLFKQIILSLAVVALLSTP